MFQNKVPVEQHGFNFRKEIVLAIQIAPASLNKTYFGVHEMVNGPREEIGRRNEIGIEDGDKLAGSSLETFLERTGFVAVTVGAMKVLDGVAHIAVTLTKGFGKLVSVVGRVIENLNLQQLARVVYFDHLFD